MKKIKPLGFKATQEKWSLKVGNYRGSERILVAQGLIRSKAIDDLAKNPTGYSQYQILDQAGDEWVKEANPEADDAFNESISRYYSRLLDHSERTLFAAHALNGFLGEKDDSLVYSDWLDQHWSELLERVETGKYSRNAYTLQVFNRRADSPVMLRLDRDLTYQALAKRTLGEVKLVFNSAMSNASVAGVDLNSSIDGILLNVKEKVKLPKIADIEARLFKMYFVTFGKADLSLMNLYQESIYFVSKEISNVRSVLIDNVAHRTSKNATTGEFIDVLNGIERIAPELKFYEYMTVLHAIRNPSSFIAQPPAGSLSAIHVLEKALSGSEDEALAKIRAILDVILLTNVKVPDYENWMEGMDDIVLNAFDPTVTTALLNAEDGYRKSLSRDRDFQKKLKAYTH